MTRGRRSTPKKKTHTPVMLQYLAAKEAYPGAILFFRLGDFYEMFFSDAIEVAERLGITQTFRGKDPEGNPIPMAGVPHHAAAGYISRLLKQGQKIAICEQMADPKTVKGVVPRQVVRVITPGLCLDEDNLDAAVDNYLVTLAQGPDGIGLAALELSTGQLRACALESEAAAFAELVRLDPREIVFPAQGFENLWDTVESADLAVARREELDSQGILERLLGADVDALDQGVHVREAAARALAYAQLSQPGSPILIQRVGPYDPRAYLVLDEVAVRNLEIVRTLSGDKKGALLGFIDATCCAMGARLLRRRMLAPLLDVAAIRRRHDVVQALVDDAILRDLVRTQMRSVADLERLATRAAAGLATPRDLGSIRNSLEAIQGIQQNLVKSSPSTLQSTLADSLPEDCSTGLWERLSATLVDQPPTNAKDGGYIRTGFDSALDADRAISENAKDLVLAMEARERKRTGIASLKVRFNKVFGYFIEVTRSNLSRVPDDYTRKQTVSNGERFITDELQELHDLIAGADDRAKKRETVLFDVLRGEVGALAVNLRALANQIAAVDVAASWAEIASQHGYCRPEVDEGVAITLLDSRHPIVERLSTSGTFVPNDVSLDADGERLMILTGPNMSGKSTVMRQVALIAILAQAGGFVPARVAHVGLVDRVFTRVGASDNLGAGQSTFMVEMKEAAEILRTATPRSLVVLDEVGRGTSTYDGLAIAWAIAEHLHDAVGCRGMFSTHYHELCELAEICSGVANYNVAAREYGDEVVFLHKLVRGGANRSYGVAVAQLAGVPAVVLARAKALLRDLEDGAPLPSGAPARVRPLDGEGRAQMELFSAVPPTPVRSPVLETLRELDVNHMTPVDALVALGRLRTMLDREQS